MTTQLRTTLAAAVTTLVLAIAACAGTGTPGHTARITASTAVRSASPTPALTQSQLDAATITTADVQALHMGVARVTPDNTVISNGSLHVHPDQCQPVMDTWQGGTPDYTATAADDLKIPEADATGAPAVHFLHIAAYSGTTAQTYLDAVTAAAQHCAAYDQPDTDGTIHVTVAPASVSLGDQSTAWRSVLTNGTTSYTAAITIVRVGNNVITAVELSDAVSTPDQLPLTNTQLLGAQIDKLCSTTGQ